MKTMKPGTRWCLMSPYGALNGLRDEADGVVVEWSGNQVPPLCGSEWSMKDLNERFFDLTGERCMLVNLPDEYQFKPLPPIL